MINIRASSPLLSPQYFYLLLILIVTLAPTPSHAKGKGPVGIWAASERHVLVADSSLPGIVLVDLRTGAAIERLVLNGNPTCITSCANCDFALVTGKKGTAWRLHFEDNINTLLKKNVVLNLKDARIEAINFEYPNGSKHGKIDGRMCLVDNDGKNAYIAALRDNAVFRLDLSKKPSLSPILKNTFLNSILKNKIKKPFGLNWDKNNNLLVSMHRKKIWRINVQGQKLASYDVTKAQCPGTERFKLNLRAAIDDPLNKNSLIILASNESSYDAVIWRLQYSDSGKPTQCKILAGGLGKGSGWVDSATGGENVIFSRPHHFALLSPDNTDYKIVVTDIDNRALRVINLGNSSSTTVMYDRDRRVPNTPVDKRQSKASCTQLQWTKEKPLIGVLGNKSCLQKPIKEALNLSFDKAQAYCQKLGSRLCEPTELRQSKMLDYHKTWTNAECASCWHRDTGLRCDANIKTYRAPGHHRSKGFKQSWNSGQAIEIGETKDSGPSTFCSPTTNKETASAFCCADNF